MNRAEQLTSKSITSNKIQVVRNVNHKYVVAERSMIHPPPKRIIRSYVSKMALFNTDKMISEIQTKLTKANLNDCEKEILEMFMRDFSLRFCWSSNALEGNTLSLDETVSVIEYDEVRSGHTFREYREAKNLYNAIQKMLLPFRKQNITEEWIQKTNQYIMNQPGEYRKTKVFIGSLIEAVYYPPAPEKVPELMKNFTEKWNTKSCSPIKKETESEEVVEDIRKSVKNRKKPSDFWEQLAREYIEFESIHPFIDGNGRTGRMLMNQCLINAGYLPIAIEPTGKYRQAFRRYEKNNDISQMVYVICKAETEAIDRLEKLQELSSRE